ncbi:MAG: YCF48-related protein [Candidatus Poribacteria bacterium]
MKSKITLCLFVIIASLFLNNIMVWADGKWEIVRDDDFVRNDGIEGELRDIFFVDENNGWAVGGSLILHTSDGGATWEMQTASAERPPELWCVYFRDAKFGVVAGSIPGRGFGGGTVVFTTGDGGKTWVQQTEFYDILFSVSSEFQSDLDSKQISEGLRQEFENEGITLSDRAAVVIDENTGRWMITDNRRRYSIRKGEDKLNICVDVRSRLTDIQMIDEKIGYATGESKTVLKTTDGGKTWIAVMTGQRARAGETRKNLDGLYFVAPEIGWAVGSFGLVLYTTDGGKNWEQQKTETPNDLKAVHFVNDKEGWAVGMEGAILHTTNSGKTWEKQKSNTYNSLHSVAFVDENTGWACGDFGTVVQTTDSGKTWKPGNMDIRKAGTLSAISAFKQNLWAICEWGLIIRYTTQ